MKDLKDLLDLSNYSENNLNVRFQEIAETLMGNYVIRKGNKDYVIVEIEFYLYSQNHRDFITYPRNIESGRWFFHQSGVDLSFRSVNIENHISCFGGILIRGIYHNSCGYIFGPQKCVDVLWNDLDAFDGKSHDNPALKRTEETLPLNLFRCKRYINIKGVDRQKSKIRDWAKRLDINVSDEDIKNYWEELFENSDTMRYRFFNMQNGEEPWNFLKIPSTARPKEAETEKID